MSYENFDYDKALNSIKATLFDIYEAQERLVGSIEDDGKRQIQINKYIKMKNTAINLIKDVENLTNDQIVRNVVNEQEQTKNEENVDSEPKLVEINLNSKTDELLKESDNTKSVDEVPVEESVEEIDKEATNDEPNTNIDTDTDTDNATFEEDTTEQTSSNTETIENDDNSVELPKEEKQEISNESNDSQEDIKEEEIEEEKQSENEDVKEESVNKFYLDDRNGTKPNFAFVPKELYSVIKKNGIFELNLNAKEEINDAKDDRIHKTDENKPKGIIVRNDQFMKLALSKRRQEGVLADAKIFRVEQAKASRKKMLEEEEKKLDIKTKNLKLAI